MMPLIYMFCGKNTPSSLLGKVDGELQQIVRGQVILFKDGVRKMHGVNVPPHLTRMAAFELR